MIRYEIASDPGSLFQYSWRDRPEVQKQNQYIMRLGSLLLTHEKQSNVGKSAILDALLVVLSLIKTAIGIFYGYKEAQIININCCSLQPCALVIKCARDTASQRDPRVRRGGRLSGIKLHR